MECPFNDLEFADFPILDFDEAVQVGEIKSILELVQYNLQIDPILYPALSVALRLLDTLEDFLDGEGDRYDQLKKEYDKRRALAEACRLAKAPGEDRGSTRSENQSSITENASQ